MDINLLCSGAAIAGAASAFLYARKKRWPDAALAGLAGVSLAALLAAPTAPGPAGRAVLLDSEDWRAAPAGAMLAPADGMAAALASLPEADSIDVRGHGLHEAQWRDLPVRRVQWQPAQDGLLWLDFPRALPLGRSFALTARRGGNAQAGWRLQLLAENGQVLAESRATAATQALTVQWQPPMPESMVLQARLLDKEGKTVAQGPLPLRVLDAVPLQVQGRFGAPSFDTRALNQLLTDSNAIVDWQTTLGKSLTRSEEARAPLAQPNAMVADAAWLERGGLRSALAQAAQGVPLLVLGGNADDAALWQRELGLRLAALSATTEQEDVRHLALPGATLAFAPGAQLPVAAGGAAWQIVARDKDGKPWLWQRDWQKGRILWLGVRDWHRHAISEPAALGAWWQQVVDLAAVGSAQKMRWLDAEPMPLAGLRSEVCAQGVATGGAVTVGQQALRWQARGDRADAACVAFWPGKAGWVPLASGGERSELYVFGAQDWPMWQAALRHDATARYAGLALQPVARADAGHSAVAAGADGQPGAGVPRPGAGGIAGALGGALPRWLLGLAFAASLLALWWRERR
ncbi:hypothetical protein GTP41_21950 [Pseudoduganella sp. DS3]|uniref:Uncharacterized protein n=1 Tax=Pseudoduganella guangdongensis TaxID=2692179 RepID=A0A6N9HM49_9BURK|nr:hypothetical protein [Pseudoduganella guangdongensis]